MSNGLVDLYSTRAHVFQINTETRNSWLAKGDSAIPITFISILTDSPTPGSRELKLVAAGENGETILDSTIAARTVFNKRSQKFGQWTDPTGMIYGLGFNSEAELNEFISTFQALQVEILQPVDSSASPQQLSSDRAQAARNRPQDQQQQQINNSSSEINGREQSAAASTAIGGDSTFSGQVSSVLGQVNQQQQHQLLNRKTPGSQVGSENDANNNSNLNGNGTRYTRGQSVFGSQSKPSSTGRSTPDGEGSTTWQSESNARDQLEYENERLKQALEESSKNAGVWQSELTNLRTNNVKLTQALQESKAHVEEWERELFSLRDENKELKLRVMALESSSDPEKINEYKAELQKYKGYVDSVQGELRRKENEIEDLQRAMEDLELRANPREGQNGRSDDATSVEVAISLAQKQRFDSINAKLEAKIGELLNVQKEYAQLADKLYH